VWGFGFASIPYISPTALAFTPDDELSLGGLGVS
jgi:hypothetical protein